MENDVTKEEEIVISTHHWTVDDDLNNSGGIRWRNIMVRTAPVRRYNKDNKNERRGEGGDANDDYVDDGSYLLHPSSGFVKNGHICGILGPSGT
eukprot:12985379-Ditylum_brightwellii.AAC.2